LGSKQKLKSIYLNNNKLSGSISSSIGELNLLEELMLSSNVFTGSIPITIGLLQNLVNLSFSYNQMKGEIPAELSSLTSLNLLHLHSNRFEGSTNHINFDIHSFIADCASTETLPALVQCSRCSECCNVEGNCMIKEKVWPKSVVKSLPLSPAGFIMLVTVSSSIVLILLLTVLNEKVKKLPRLSRNIKSSFQENSVYSFYLSSSWFSWFIASTLAFVQIWIITMFIQSGDEDFPGNLLVYFVSCPKNSFNCVDHSLLNMWGYVLVGIILASFLLPDLLDGTLLMYESVVEKNIQGIIAGAIVLNIVLLTVVASFIHLKALSVSNVVIIKEAAVVLFLNSMDEKAYNIIEIAFPNWVEKINNDVIQGHVVTSTKSDEFKSWCNKLDEKIKQIRKASNEEVSVNAERTIAVPAFDLREKTFDDKKTKMLELSERMRAKLIKEHKGRKCVNDG